MPLVPMMRPSGPLNDFPHDLGFRGWVHEELEASMSRIHYGMVIAPLTQRRWVSSDTTVMEGGGGFSSD